MSLPDVVVAPSWLAQHLRDPSLQVVDVRWSPEGGFLAARRTFEEDGHIPGAIFVDLDRHLSATPAGDERGRHPLPEPDAFAASMAGVGVDERMDIVVVDDVQGSVAARLWWMLSVTGRSVAMLDGGLQAWTREGGDLERGPGSQPARGTFHPAMWPVDRIVDADAVDLTIRVGSAPVIDVRVPERFRGEVEPLDPVAGHIPGAVNAPWTENLDPDTGRFLAPEVLRERYAALGVTGDAAIVHCGSGVTACHGLLALRLAGFGDARLYEGSWSGWVADPERPIATGSA
jgi:thiosulfate/3-mercaptopyruvate sulfurtransferase